MSPQHHRHANAVRRTQQREKLVRSRRKVGEIFIWRAPNLIDPIDDLVGVSYVPHWTKVDCNVHGY